MFYSFAWSVTITLVVNLLYQDTKMNFIDCFDKNGNILIGMLYLFYFWQNRLLNDFLV